MGWLICKICFDRDDMVSSAVVEHRCTNEYTGKRFSAHVCEQCLDRGCETRVTCRTFVEIPGAAHKG
jgi:hypothetical protein